MTVNEVLAAARQLYPQRGFGFWLQRNRPRISPFHIVLPLVPPEANVLDVGCGSGLFLGLLAHQQRITRGVGFDASHGAIALANDMKRQLPGVQADRLRFDRIDVGEAWPEGTFDVVALIDVIHHIPPAHQREVLLTAWQKTAPGGMFLYKDMAARPVVCGLMNRLHDLVKARQWIHYLNPTRADEWLHAAGATIEQAGACRMFWYQHDWRVYRKAAN